MAVLHHSLAVIFLVGLTQSLSRDGWADVFGHGQQQFEIEFVTIGHPGNSPDLDNQPNSWYGPPPNPIPVGDVPYVFRMGKYEITRDVVEKANALGDLGITLFDMTDAGGNGPEQPATGINWYEAAVFANWLNISTGHPEAYKFESDSFALWDSGDVGFNPNNPFRNHLAHYFIPSVDEWYKAAFYDGEATTYHEFATGSDIPPTPVASGTTPGTAVYHQRFPAPSQAAGGLSPYGTMGQSGNVWEWEETEFDHSNDRASAERGLRSGNWDDNAEHISASYRNPFFPWIENQFNSFGFRVAAAMVTGVAGDFNANGALDAGDIDMLLPGASDPSLDLNNDGKVDDADRSVWVSDLAKTWYGDVDLNGEFNTADLAQVFTVGRYETGEYATWTEGDWDGNTLFDTGDFIISLADGGYETGPRTDAELVPEPAGAMPISLAMCLFCLLARQSKFRACPLWPIQGD